MFQLLSFFQFFARKRWMYGFLSLIFAISIVLTNAQTSRAISWLDLIRSGAQIYQLSSISDKEEIKLGREINQELIRSGQARIYRNPQITRYVNRIGQRLAQHSQRPNIPYTFQVVDDNNVNAFATMGGYVYIHTGLMETAENEAELASVIGHEIGHIAGRHAIEQMRQRAISQGVLSAAGLERSQAVQIGVELAVNRRNSREDELEADGFGLDNLQKAGYAPSAMVSFMKKLLQQGNSIPTFLSTHPATSERIRLLQQNIDSKTANVGNGLNSKVYRNRIRSI